MLEHEIIFLCSQCPYHIVIILLFIEIRESINFKY